MKIAPFLIYYGGVPMSANGLRHLFGASRGHPIVAFGNAWRHPRLADAVRKAAPHTRLYGYADVGQVTLAHVLQRVRLLGRMRFSGVLLDDVGTGLSAHVALLQTVVEAAHREGPAVIMNAWEPRQVLGLHLRRGVDAVLCENWVYADGAWHSRRSSTSYRAPRNLQARGAVMRMVVTARRAPVSPSAIALAVRRTEYKEAGSYIAVSGPNYSAMTDAVFPARALRRVLSGVSF